MKYVNGPYVIESRDLGRTYSSLSWSGIKSNVTTAIAGLNLRIPRGVVFGLLGPNGAGKTTTIKILTTLLSPSSGSASVLGFDVVKDSHKIRQHIGVVFGGERGLYPRLTGKENLLYYGAINRLEFRNVRKQIDDVLNIVSLLDVKDKAVRLYSLGMKQRLHLARGLLTDPMILFLDEPTIGLDPVGARAIRQLIPRLIAEGKTVVLTTHYMYEADALCNVVGIINHGKMIAYGTPEEIKKKFASVEVIELLFKERKEEVIQSLKVLEGVRWVDVTVENGRFRVSIFVKPSNDIRAQIQALISSTNEGGFSIRQPTLEEAYISILK